MESSKILNDNEINIQINENSNLQNNLNPIEHKKTYINNNNIINELQNEFLDNSYNYIFHVNIEILYNLFIAPDFLPNTFFNKSKLTSMKNKTNAAEEGNEIEIESSSNHNKFKMRVLNSINTPYYKSFTHDIIEKPTLFAGFTTTFNFFWDSIEQITILQIIIIIKDSLYKTSIADYMFPRHNQKFKIICDYLEENCNNLEQEESISINKNIIIVWNFLIEINNIKNFFYDSKFNNNIEIGIIHDRENEIEIIDKEKKNKIRILISLENNQDNDNEKEILLQIISSIIPIPKQRIKLKIIKIDENNSMLFYSHQILQFLDSDILGSYSFIKKKTLWEIKGLIENLM
jgi:hypothetical protein